MKTLEYHFVADKETWGDGPWVTEFDKKQWCDPETGLSCLIVRGPVGALCGYVGVPDGHPCYRVDYGDVSDAYGNIDVHGGLTFAGFCQEGLGDHSICHKVEDGEDDNIWWLGFDCAHAGDLAPIMNSDRLRRELSPDLRAYLMQDVYRDVAYVTEQCATLARQLVEVREDRETTPPPRIEGDVKAYRKAEWERLSKTLREAVAAMKAARDEET